MVEHQVGRVSREHLVVTTHLLIINIKCRRATAMHKTNLTTNHQFHKIPHTAKSNKIHQAEAMVEETASIDKTTTRLTSGLSISHNLRMLLLWSRAN